MTRVGSLGGRLGGRHGRGGVFGDRWEIGVPERRGEERKR